MKKSQLGGGDEKKVLYIPVSSDLHTQLVGFFKSSGKTKTWNEFVETYLNVHKNKTQYSGNEPIQTHIKGDWYEKTKFFIHYIHIGEIKPTPNINLGNILPTYSPYIEVDSQLYDKMFEEYTIWKQEIEKKEKTFSWVLKKSYELLGGR